MTTQILRTSWLFILAILFMECNSPSHKEIISFYNVPLKCGAAPDIGCGSRIKPLFIDNEKETSIKESWTNRQGTVIAIVWRENENEKRIQSLFTKNDIEATLIFDADEVNKISTDFRQQGKWLKGMEVDQLSLEEAGVIAKDLSQFAEKEKLITPQESEQIYKDIEAYFKKELVVVRTSDDLKSAATQNRWMHDGYAIYKKHIGKKRADSVKAFYSLKRKEYIDVESCCDKIKTDKRCEKKEEASAQSEITCPKCGHKKTETLPTDVCLLKYTCEKCKADLFPKEGDCCVFCSYGNHKCPSKQS